ncbi:hypothetical protein BZA70DRAFT_175315 [Myxozyma melibiosi]|uniref:Uncharacterized protein n=1 Tax=Myxozyma melibiosi TaxID=54550 RepID=A0ABR1F5S0_9ASCO
MTSIGVSSAASPRRARALSLVWLLGWFSRCCCCCCCFISFRCRLVEVGEEGEVVGKWCGRAGIPLWSWFLCKTRVHSERRRKMEFNKNPLEPSTIEVFKPEQSEQNNHSSSNKIVLTRSTRRTEIKYQVDAGTFSEPGVASAILARSTCDFFTFWHRHMFILELILFLFPNPLSPLSSLLSSSISDTQHASSSGCVPDRRRRYNPLTSPTAEFLSVLSPRGREQQIKRLLNLS